MQQFKKVVYIIKSSECIKVYSDCTEAGNYRISLHKSNMKLPEKRKPHV